MIQAVLVLCFRVHYASVLLPLDCPGDEDKDISVPHNGWAEAGQLLPGMHYVLSACWLPPVSLVDAP